MLAMLGLVLADNLIALFVFWELTTITSFLLIGYSHESPVARRSALQGLLVTGAGALAMLAGFVVLGQATGTFSLREMLARPEGLSDHRHYTAIVALILLGAFTKSAQFPFHFWLPKRDGGSDAGLCLSALSNHGQGGRIPAGSSDTSAGRYRSMVGDADRSGRSHSRVLGDRGALRDPISNGS